MVSDKHKYGAGLKGKNGGKANRKCFHYYFYIVATDR